MALPTPNFLQNRQIAFMRQLGKGHKDHMPFYQQLVTDK